MNSTLPNIIQGGMGVSVSNWKLARAVALKDQLGVVSGTALETVMIRRLQNGDEGGHMRRAIKAFPLKNIAQEIIQKYFIEGGKETDKPYRLAPMATLELSDKLCELLMVANFVEIFLAKEGHEGQIGINYLEKIALPTLPSIFGAILAGVDYILMGAGIPLAIPGVIDKLSNWEQAELPIAVTNKPKDVNFIQYFDPKKFFPENRPKLTRPKFLAIVSTDIVAKTMIRKASGPVDGFVLESHHAGGHNAPPRKVAGASLEAFSVKDEIDPKKFLAFERPFWIAGGYASKQGLKEAIDCGAQGVQAGSVFAYCDESGIDRSIKDLVIEKHFKKNLKIHTDFKASPTGYPFKVIEQDLDPEEFCPQERQRVCDLGYLREAYCDDEGNFGLRCPSESIKNYVKKGGKEEDSEGRQCLCNGLLSTVEMAQVRKGKKEAPLLTAGDDFTFLDKLTDISTLNYSAADVIDMMLNTEPR